MAKQLDPRLVERINSLMPGLTKEDKLDMCWLLERPESRGGPVWMMKHHWVTRLGDAAGVRLDDVQWLAATKDFAACQVMASLGPSVVWTTGEASDRNSLSPYPVAIAEKRAKDRAVLKLLGLHGDLLSDEEMEVRQEREEKTAKTVAIGETKYPFDAFWDAYDKKVGSKRKCAMKWARLREVDRVLAMSHIPAYVASTPDKTFRKNPERYISGRLWESEELPTGPGRGSGRTGRELTYAQMLSECDKYPTRKVKDYEVVRKEDGGTRFIYNG